MNKILGAVSVSVFSLAIFSAYANDSTSSEPPQNLAFVAYQISTVGTPIDVVLPRDGGTIHCSGNNIAYFFYGVGLKDRTNYWSCNTLQAGYQE